jgi:hypothetical protein
MAIYRGASAVAVAALSNDGGSAHTATLSGFTPASNHAGLLAIGRSFGAGGDVVNVAAPTGFTRRGFNDFYYNFQTGNAAYRTWHALYDRLTPPNAIYAGQSFTSTWTSSSGSISLYILELRK